jgi:FHS family L-fucose permease-like MFS transporter
MSIAKANVTGNPLLRDRIFPTGHMLPFSLVTSLFFMWGIPNNLNDVLIRQFMKSFALTRFEAGLVQSAFYMFYMGYFLLAIPAALLMRRFGYKTGILVGLGSTARVLCCSGRQRSRENIFTSSARFL